MQTGVMGEITPLRRGVVPQEDELCEDCGPRGFMPRRNAEWERLDEPEGGERLRRSTALGFPETYSEGWNSHARVVRDALGQDTFEKAWTEGSALSTLEAN